MNDHGFTSAYDNVFERLAVADTTSSARKKTAKKSLYGMPQTDARPHTPSSLYENPSFSSTNSRRVNAALFDRLANTETYATAKMKGKVPERKRSSSTPRKTSNAFFERMAYTETFASAQMKGLINSENENNERAVSRGRSVKSAKSTRTASRGRNRESESSFFDRMAKTETYASTQLKGKYLDPQTPSTKHKYTPKRHVRTDGSIFDRLSRTQTKSSAQQRKAPVTPDPATSRSSIFGRSKNYTEPRRSKPRGSFTPKARKYSSNASVGSAKSATSAKSAYTAKSLRSATSMRSAYTAPSIRTANTTRTAATTKSSTSSRAQSLTSSYHSERSKPVTRTPVKRTPLVKATSPTAEYAGGRPSARKKPSSYLPSKFTSSSLKNRSSTPAAPQTANKSLRAPSTTTPKPAPEPRPVLQFESDDELSFGDESEEEEDFLAAPSSVKAAPQDAGTENGSEKQDSHERATPYSTPTEEDNMESPMNDLTLNNSINMSYGTDDEDRNENDEDPMAREEVAASGEFDDPTVEVGEDDHGDDAFCEADGDRGMEDDYQSENGELENEEYEPQDEVDQQDEEHEVEGINRQANEDDAGHVSDDGLSIGSEESANEWPEKGEDGKEADEAPQEDQDVPAADEDHDDPNDMDAVGDELGDLLDSQSESPQLSVEEAAAAESDSIGFAETEDSVPPNDAVDSLDDVMTDDDKDNEMDPADEGAFDDELGETEQVGTIEELESLDLVLDATGDEDDVSVECEEPLEEDFFEDSEAESMTKEEEELGELMDEEEYLSEGGGDEFFDEQAIEDEPVAEAEEAEKEPTYTIIKSEKYHPEFGFQDVNPEEIFLTETLLAFEEGEISNQEMAVLLIEALFEKNFENGDHWEIDAGTARELEEDEGGGGDLEGRAFVVKRQARLDWNDLYSVAAAKGSIIICPDEKEIRVENYSYFVAG